MRKLLLILTIVGVFLQKESFGNDKWVDIPIKEIPANCVVTIYGPIAPQFVVGVNSEDVDWKDYLTKQGIVFHLDDKVIYLQRLRALLIWTSNDNQDLLKAYFD